MTKLQSYRLGRSMVAAVILVIGGPACLPLMAADDANSAAPVLVESKRIWDKAPHNAFTDLLRFNDRWYCVFREGSAHASPDGSIRVITSVDGTNGESIAFVTSSQYDLRDAKLTPTPDGRLMLNGAGMIADARIRYYSMSWFSDDKGRRSPDRRSWILAVARSVARQLCLQHRLQYRERTNQHLSGEGQNPRSMSQR